MEFTFGDYSSLTRAHLLLYGQNRSWLFCWAAEISSKICSRMMFLLPTTSFGSLKSVTIPRWLLTRAQVFASTLGAFEAHENFSLFWKNDGLEVSVFFVHQAYGYEYLGSSRRLVLTPLTLRCFQTILLAIHQGFGMPKHPLPPSLSCILRFHMFLESNNHSFAWDGGGLVEGGVATGKTETVKDLAAVMAKHCVVINCSPDLNATSFSTLFKVRFYCFILDPTSYSNRQAVRWILSTRV